MDDLEDIYIISLRVFQIGPSLESQMFLYCKAVLDSRMQVVITQPSKEAPGESTSLQGQCSISQKPRSDRKASMLNLLWPSFHYAVLLAQHKQALDVFASPPKCVISLCCEWLTLCKSYDSHAIILSITKTQTKGL